MTPELRRRLKAIAKIAEPSEEDTTVIRLVVNYLRENIDREDFTVTFQPDHTKFLAHCKRGNEFEIYGFEVYTPCGACVDVQDPASLPTLAKAIEICVCDPAFSPSYKHCVWCPLKEDEDG